MAWRSCAPTSTASGPTRFRHTAPRSRAARRARKGPSAMYEPLVKTIEVPCDQREAFDVFVNEMSTWWPLTRFSASVKFGASPGGLRVDARLGGKIVETSQDGTEHVWGTITAFEPPGYVRMN